MSMNCSVSTSAVLVMMFVTVKWLLAWPGAAWTLLA
jgi:hypothetical protein